jgi:hypothetical protein
MMMTTGTTTASTIIIKVATITMATIQVTMITTMTDRELEST